MKAGRSALLAPVLVTFAALANVSAAEIAPPPAVMNPPATPATAAAASSAPDPGTAAAATQSTSGPFGPAVEPLVFERANVSIRFGLLVQPQYQSIGDTTFTGQAQDLYVRRARVIVGGTVLGVFDYFFDTDYPDLFLSRASVGSPSIKYTPSMNIQDAFLTYRPLGQVLMVDAGYFLPPMAHNAVQSAATLFGWDYFRYTFQHDQAFGSPQNLTPPTTPAGRDTGVQLRGLVLGGHLEFRVGAFQGLRGAKTTSAQGAENSFRFTSRLQINLLDPETGFFYAGTYLGRKRILSIGGSYDFQNSFSKGYLYLAGDAFLDLPVGPGVVTAQLNVAHWNGHDFIPVVVVTGQTGTVLQEQTAVMAEAGYTFFATRLSPILRFEHLEGPLLPPQNRYGIGVAFWPFGHNSNLKAFYTRTTQEPPAGAPPYHAANQVNVQWQLYFF